MGAQRRRPTLTLRSAGWLKMYASPNERYAEFSDGNGVGGILVLRSLDDGTLQVVIQNCDKGVVVVSPAALPESGK